MPISQKSHDSYHSEKFNYETMNIGWVKVIYISLQFYVKNDMMITKFFMIPK